MTTEALATLVESIAGADPMRCNRSRPVVLARTLLANALLLQGGTENSVGEEMGYDASTIHHYRQLLRDAQNYGTDPYLLRDWQKLKNTLDL